MLRKSGKADEYALKYMRGANATARASLEQFPAGSDLGNSLSSQPVRRVPQKAASQPDEEISMQPVSPSQERKSRVFGLRASLWLPWYL